MCPYFSRWSMVMRFCVRTYSTDGIVVWGWRHHFRVRRGLFVSMPCLGKILFGRAPYPLHSLHCSVVCCIQHLGSRSFLSKSFLTYIKPPNYLYLVFRLHTHSSACVRAYSTAGIVVWGCRRLFYGKRTLHLNLFMIFVWFWTAYGLIIFQLHCTSFALFIHCFVYIALSFCIHSTLLCVVTHRLHCHALLHLRCYAA